MGEKQNLTVGDLGEDIAKDYLEKKGYKIIVQNYRTKYCEIDLVARYKKTLVCIEVRTKSQERFGSPEDTLDKRKVSKLIKNAFFYVWQTGYRKAYRIDIICIVLARKDKPKRISHYQNITL